MNPFLGFWKKLERPIIGLSPMDGVTDFAFRAMMARHGRPALIFTEFVTATGMFYAPDRVLPEFEYSEAERPIIAQIFGNEPDDFYKAAHVVCELGFDGVDINMGCPSKTVTKKCGGAQLIEEPALAVAIIRATQKGVRDWAGGQKLEVLGVSEQLLGIVESMNKARKGVSCRQLIPVSVKTRLGVKEIVIEKWIETLLGEKPAAITIHGRTLRQMYKGEADWKAIANAAAVAKGSGTLVLGNGDVRSREEALRRIEEAGVDGVLIGRAAIGNPWIFDGDTLKATETARIQLALEHAAYFEAQHPEKNFHSIRKHLVGYLKNFPSASDLRQRALACDNSESLRTALKHGIDQVQ